MTQMTIDIAGLGIIMYSPSSAAHIAEDANYLEERYWDPRDVQEHIQAGSIVAFATGTPGRFHLRTHDGYPDPKTLEASEFKLRLGLRSDGVVVFRDLYDLMEWTAEFPEEQAIALEAGVYHVTLCSSTPSSGILGDDQVVDVYFQALDRFPALAREGIPTLCG
jgi:hypothetical protein